MPAPAQEHRQEPRLQPGNQVSHGVVFEESEVVEKFVSLHIFNMTPIKNFKKSLLRVTTKKSYVETLKTGSGYRMIDSSYLYSLLISKFCKMSRSCRGRRAKSPNELDLELIPKCCK